MDLHAPTAATVLTWEQWDESSSSNDYGNGNDWSTYWTYSNSSGASSSGDNGGSSWWDDGSGSNTGVASLFGRTFDLTDGDSSYENDSTGLDRSSSGENYSSQDGSASFTINYNSDNTQAPAQTVTVSGWDADIGSFSTTATGTSINLATVAWPARSSPTFGGTHLWLNGVLYTWQSGTLSSSGTVADTYASTNPNASGSLVMSASVPDFKASNVSAALTVDGTQIGTLAYDSSDGPQMVSGYVAVFSNPSGTHTTPFFSADSLWLNGTTEYPFEAGYNDAFGGRMDLYVNPNAGSIILSGTSSSSAAVGGHLGPDFLTGTYSDSEFTLSGNWTLSTDPAITPEAPEALWVRGLLYTQTTPGVDTYQSTVSGSLVGTLDIAIMPDGSLQIDGADVVGAFTGSMPSGGACGWLSTVPPEGSSDSPTPVFAVFLTPKSEGGFELSPPPDSPGIGFPSAISCQTVIYVYLGEIESPSAQPEAVYFPREAPTTAQRWITVEVSAPSNGRYPALLHQLGSSGALTEASGSYTPDNHLFQTAASDTGFLPMYAANPLESDSAWLLPRPQAANLPPSFVIRGQPWWFAGYDELADTASYLGFLDGQVMSLAAADAEGYRIVTLVDPLSNSGASTQGTLSSTRRSIRFRDNTIAFSGDSIGDQAQVTYLDQFALQTVQGDLDIIGNNLSFGVLGNDASLAGSLLQFKGTTGNASLHSIVSATSASWLWSEMAAEDASDLSPVMELV